jgi:hypothetical protein
MISLHAVSGPWTSFVAALDKGRFNIAVCRRYNHCVIAPTWNFLNKLQIYIKSPPPEL